MTAPPTDQFIGRHKYSIDHDLFRLSPEGEMSAQEAQQVALAMRHLSNKLGRICLLLDMTRMSKPSPENRRIIMGSIQELNLIGAAYFGAGLELRTALILAQRAASLLGAKTHPTHFCATEAEAVAWLNNLKGTSA